MKVYVVTKALPMEKKETPVTYKSSIEAAEKFIRKNYPNAKRKDDLIQDYIRFRCVGMFDCTDRLIERTREFDMYIREKELD